MVSYYTAWKYSKMFRFPALSGGIETDQCMKWFETSQLIWANFIGTLFVSWFSVHLDKLVSRIQRIYAILQHFNLD